jgi:hypothetical protein
MDAVEIPYRIMKRHIRRAVGVLMLGPDAARRYAQKSDAEYVDGALLLPWYATYIDGWRYLNTLCPSEAALVHAREAGIARPARVDVWRVGVSLDGVRAVYVATETV